MVLSMTVLMNTIYSIRLKSNPAVREEGQWKLCMSERKILNELIELFVHDFKRCQFFGFAHIILSDGRNSLCVRHDRLVHCRTVRLLE